LGVINFAEREVRENKVLLARPKFERSLLEFASYQEPHLQMIEKLWIFYQLIRTTMTLHFAHLTHGYIKPSNLFITQNLTVYLTDSAPFKPKRIDLPAPSFLSFLHHELELKLLHCTGQDLV
jgi:phosphoinositide-3-kinase regulatory subunit 4